MNLNTCQWMAETLMREHGLEGWTFQWDRAVRRAGQCKYATRTISLSRPIAEMDDEASVRNTILHEIAHALVGSGHGHDSVWRRQARAIGCTGERTAKGPAPKGRYVAMCETHGELGSRVKRPDATRRWSCRKCQGKIVWVDTALARV